MFLAEDTGLESSSENIIRMHPDFRMMVLANRPGFPFLGNDFYAAVGQFINIYFIGLIVCMFSIDLLRTIDICKKLLVQNVVLSGNKLDSNAPV